MRLWQIMLFHSRFLWCGFFSQSFPRTNTRAGVSTVSPAIYSPTSWELQESLKAPPLFKATPCSFSASLPFSASLFFPSSHLCYCLRVSGLRTAGTLVSKKVIHVTWEQIHLLGHLSHFLRFHWEMEKIIGTLGFKKQTKPRCLQWERLCNCCSLGLCQTPLLQKFCFGEVQFIYLFIYLFQGLTIH